MSGNPTPEQLPGLIAKGLTMVEERLQKSNGAQIYDSIKAQLTYMKQVVDAGCVLAATSYRQPTSSQAARVTANASALRV